MFPAAWKKGQGATLKKGNFNARQPMSKGQPLDVATHVIKTKNMCQGQIKIFIINLIQFTVLIVFELWFGRVCINISYCFSKATSFLFLFKMIAKLEWAQNKDKHRTPTINGKYIKQ